MMWVPSSSWWRNSCLPSPARLGVSCCPSWSPGGSTFVPCFSGTVIFISHKALSLGLCLHIYFKKSGRSQILTNFTNGSRVYISHSKLSMSGWDHRYFSVTLFGPDFPPAWSQGRQPSASLVGHPVSGHSSCHPPGRHHHHLDPKAAALPNESAPILCGLPVHSKETKGQQFSSGRWQKFRMLEWNCPFYREHLVKMSRKWNLLGLFWEHFHSQRVL